MKFGVTNDGDIYLGTGWSTPSPGRTWNDGKSAEVVFGIEAPERDVEVTIGYFAYIVPGKVDRQRIRIWVNDVSLRERVITDRIGHGLKAKIPRAAL